jgi:subtilase family serine protease
MTRLLGLVTAIILMIPLGALAQFQAPARPPLDWTATPPIHVRGVATLVPTGYSPQQIRHAYGFDQLAPNDGAGQVIAIIDANDGRTAASDLQTFIAQFGLPEMYGLPGQASCTVAAGPHPCFQKIFAQSRTAFNPLWALEISLDTQWAHAIAPGADILLVEAFDARLSDLLGAIDLAVQQGASVVSMSWGGAEFSAETQLDFHFNQSGVTFVASSGDRGTPQWPAASPNVVGVGGTSLPLDTSGNLTGPETVWNNGYGSSGGGISVYEPEPGYQTGYPIPSTGGRRGVPDVAYDADPYTGVSVFDSTGFQGMTGWFRVGGTSAGAPQWAALIAIANQLRGAAGLATLSGNGPAGSPLYRAGFPPLSATYLSNYRDVTLGSNSSGFPALPGYDFATGLGSPQANNLVLTLGVAARRPGPGSASRAHRSLPFWPGASAAWVR